MDINDWTSEDLKYFIDIIRRIAREEIALNRDDRHETATVKQVNVDGTVDVYLASDPNNPVSKIKNPWGLSLSAGNKVQVLCKGGKLNNSWIGLKQ